MWLAPFRNLSISAAYLMPFFLEKGLSVAEVFVLQSIFSVGMVLFEVPGGFIADRFGRATSIRLGVLIAGLAMFAYGISGELWQFIILEVVLAVAQALFSGTDTALLLDSLKADGKEDEFVKQSQRINALGFAGIGFAVPIAVALIHFFGVTSTLIADGVLSLVGLFFAWKLVDAPHIEGDSDQKSTTWQSVYRLVRNQEVVWLVLLSTVLSTATYLGFWLTAPYLTNMGVPVVLFSAILAVRSFWKAWLSHRFVAQKRVERNMLTYAFLVGAVYLGMATGNLWFIWVLLGHDIVQALHRQPLLAGINEHINQYERATMNSIINLVQRLCYAITGPIVGWIADGQGLAAAFSVTGIVCMVIALLAIVRLRPYKTLQERR